MSEVHDLGTESRTVPPEAIESRSAGSEMENSALTAVSDVASPPTQLPEATTPEDAQEVNATPALPSRPRESPIDARVAALRALFPDFDDALLQSVLESVGGSQEKAIDVLLGMSDPDFKSESQHLTDLDEQLARRLHMEDQQQAAWQAETRQYQGPGWQNRVPIGRASPPVQEKDTMAEIQDQLNKFAESGKKTLGNLFTKVKAKISEFEQGRQGTSSQSAGYGVGGDTYPYDPGHHPYPTPVQQPYVDPNAHAAPADVRGYETTSSPRMEQSFPETTMRPPSASIDTGKIGLLPKRPVSLLQTQSPPKETQQSTDEDELEYAENPFEEGKK